MLFLYKVLQNIFYSIYINLLVIYLEFICFKTSSYLPLIPFTVHDVDSEFRPWGLPSTVTLRIRNNKKTCFSLWRRYVISIFISSLRQMSILNDVQLERRLKNSFNTRHVNTRTLASALFTECDSLICSKPSSVLGLICCQSRILYLEPMRI